MSSNKCLCVKPDSHQCTRSGSQKVGDNPQFCWQHQNCTNTVVDHQKVEKQKAEKQKAVKQKAEVQKAERQKAERQKADAQKAERQKAERQKAERQKAEAQKAERQKVERQRVEKEKKEKVEAEKKSSAIKISSISKATSPVCGIPVECLQSKSIISNIEEPDVGLIQLVRCLNKNTIDENIKGVQLSILMTLLKILQENDELKLSKKVELLTALLPEYCTAYSYWTYTDFYRNVLTTTGFADEKPIIGELLPRITLGKTYLGKFQTSKNLLNVLHIVNGVGRFVHKNSSYSKGNYSLIDYFNDVMNYKDLKLSSKSKSKTVKQAQPGRSLLKQAQPGRSLLKQSPAPIYVEDLAYKFGCNCFCRTVLIGTLLRILASNGHISIPPENIMYVHQGGQQNCADSHILLGILIEGDPTDLSNYLYVESTYDASTPELSDNVLNYLNFSVGTYKKSDTFHITDAPIDLIVISEYLNRNPLSLTIWLKYGSDLLDHEIFNNILIYSPEINETERFGRIYGELKMFINSSTMWAQYKHLIESLPQLVGKLLAEMKSGVKYKGKDAKHILSQYLTLETGSDTESIGAHYKKIIGIVLGMMSG